MDLLRTVGREFLAFFSSLQLSLVILVLLALITFLGTEAQVPGVPLYDIQQRYFESWYFFEEVPALGLTALLPGGLTLMGLLMINLVVGGMLRMKRDIRRLGILTTHVGVAMLILAGGLKIFLGTEGSVALKEGEAAEYYDSYHVFEVVIQETIDGETKQWTIDEEALRRADGPEGVTVTAEGLPFEIELSHYARNSTLGFPRQHRPESDPPLVDGFFIRRQADADKSERNISAVVATLRGLDGTTQQGILWASGRSGWLTRFGEREFVLRIRKERFELPFSLQLEDFTVEFHPNTRDAKLFESVVEVDDEDGNARVPIRMNEPLHRGDFVIYQESWGPQDAVDSSDPRLFSGFAVSKNPVDTWPWWSCGVIAFGMVWHFGAMLRRYLIKEAR